MFDNFLSTKALDTESARYRSMVEALERDFAYRSTSASSDITDLGDFPKLHRLTREFYEESFADIFRSYVPLYHSLWKMRLKDVRKIENLHQDGGVHYFSANGYQSRMITLWTNLYKDRIPGLSESDMGIFVLDNQHPANAPLYERMAEENTHYVARSNDQLVDNMYVCGGVLSWDLSKLEKRYLDYREGVTLSFNSHLLHGTKAFAGDLTGYSPETLEKFRVSLTSVWLHKDDVNWSVVSMPESAYETLYLSKVEEDMWPDVKEGFEEACAMEHTRLRSISSLIKEHTGGAHP